MSNLFEALAAAGFGDDLVPIAPPGSPLSPKAKDLTKEKLGKVPAKFVGDGWCGFAKWTNFIASENDFREWDAWGAGVGLQCRRVVALDLDIRDKALCDDIEREALRILGPAPCRVGQAPKRLLAYRVPAGTRIGKAIMKLGDGDAIEILGDGQQFVVAGRHPKTLTHYAWNRERGDLGRGGFDGLTEVTVEQLNAFLDAAAKVAALHGRTVTRARVAAKDAPAVTTSPLAPLPIGPGVSADQEKAESVFLKYLATQPPVAEGGRDNAVNIWATRARRIGVAQGSVPNLILEHGPWDGPPLDDAEIAATVGSVYRSPNITEGDMPDGGMRPIVEPTFTAVLGATPKTARPVIQIQGGFLPANVDAAEAALIQAGASVYQRGEMIVAPTRVVVPASDERSTVAVRLKQLTAPAIVEEMTKAAQFQRFDKRSDEWRSIDCPPNVAATYLARAEWKLPVLVGVVTAPTLRSDGSILDRPGYDTATGFLYDPGSVKFDPIPAQPSRDEALSALATIKHLISTVPFTTLAARSVALAAILTGVARSSVPTAPWFGFSAPVAGSGKTMVCDIVSEIAHGDAAPIVAQGRTEEETEKRLGAMLIEGANLINLDNCTLPLSGDLMCQMTTEKNLKVRVLGQSRTVLAPVIATLLATGNNLTVAGDMTRRVLLSEIDPGVERPELRTFNFDPIALIRAERPKYVGAVLTILRAFWVAGRPSSGIVALASFAEWSRTIRDALVWLGETDPVTTTADTRESDPERTALASLLHNWASVIGDRRVTVKQAIDAATVFATVVEREAGTAFREAVMTVAESHAGRQALDAKRLGQYLSRVQGRIVDGRSIERAGVSAGAQMWRLSGSIAATA